MATLWLCVHPGATVIGVRQASSPPSLAAPTRSQQPSTGIARVGFVGVAGASERLQERCALAGVDVAVYEPDRVAAEVAHSRIVGSLDCAARFGELSDRGRDRACSRLRYVHDLADLAERELVIECLNGDEPGTVAMLADIDRSLPDPGSIVASTTSAVPIGRLAAATERPERVVGLHCLPPTLGLGLVEVVSSVLTAPAVADRVRQFGSTTLGTQTISVADRPGLVVNGLLVPYLLSAIRMVEGGVASAADVDRGMEHAVAPSVGPLRLSDQIGLDTLAELGRFLRDEHRDTSFAPPALLTRMVDAGLLGIKAGRGFYFYR